MRTAKLSRCSEELELRSALLETIGDGVIAHTLDGKVVYANEQASRMMGYEPLEMLELEPWAWVAPEKIEGVPDLLAAVRTEDGQLYDTMVRTKQGHIISAEVHSRIVDMPGFGELVVSVSRDVTARTAAHETMRHLAFHDTLTGLGNRAMLEDRLVHALSAADRHGDFVGVVYMDLDDFKPVNDSHGHGMGDRVLRIIGERLMSCVRDTDTVTRVGGDEFIALFPRLKSEADLGAKAKSLAQCVAMPFDIGGIVVRISASVGLATYEADEQPEELITRADHAMYRAKLHGVAGWEEFLARVV